MRVLYLCHRIPYPPDKGEKIRAFHQVRAIAAHHDVEVFTLADDPRDLAHRGALAAYCRELTVAPLRPKLARLRSLPYLFTRMPLTLSYFHSAELGGAVRRALTSRAFDRIFVYCSAMAQYAPFTESIPVIIDLVDVDSDKWAQYAAHIRFPLSAVYRREARALQVYEKRVCEASACAVVSTEREAGLARRIAPRANIHALPNGVDTEYFSRAGAAASREPAVIFTGDMSYFPNEQAVMYFAMKVLPLIRRSVPNVRFLIVGRNPGPKVQALRQSGNVEVTGFVPDVRTWLARARVAVAPFTIAAGIQNKILEAMAFGLPVVATPTAAQGLVPEVRLQVETGDSPEELARKTSALLLDAQLAERRGGESRTVVSRHYRWEEACERLLHLVEHPHDCGAASSARRGS